MSNKTNLQEYSIANMTDMRISFRLSYLSHILLALLQRSGHMTLHGTVDMLRRTIGIGERIPKEQSDSGEQAGN